MYVYIYTYAHSLRPGEAPKAERTRHRYSGPFVKVRQPVESAKAPELTGA